MTIQLHRLEGFYWVSKHEGYAAAARNFPYPITQPAVHQQVKKLEGDLGCRLFERITKDRLRHTDEGRRLFAFCAPFFEELPRVVRGLRLSDFGGEVSIDATPLAVRNLVPQWIRSMGSERRDIRVNLTEVSKPDVDRLRTGEADFVVDAFEEIPDGFERRELGIAHSFLVVCDDHPAAKRKKLKAPLLQGAPFIAYPEDTRHYRLQRQTLASLGVLPGELLVTQTSESVLSFVAAGLGFSVVPWGDKSGPATPGVSARRLKGLDLEVSIDAVWRPGPGKNPLHKAALSLAPNAASRKQRQ